MGIWDAHHLKGIFPWISTIRRDFDLERSQVNPLGLLDTGGVCHRQLIIDSFTVVYVRIFGKKPKAYYDLSRIHISYYANINDKNINDKNFISDALFIRKKFAARYNALTLGSKYEMW